MAFKIALLVMYCLLRCVTSEDLGFKYNGFWLANMNLDSVAVITSGGLLKLTDMTKQQQQGHAFYPSPINFKNSNGSAYSFSTSFVFAIESKYQDISGQGMAFVIAPTRGLQGALPNKMNGRSQGLDISLLPKLPNEKSKLLTIGLPTISSFVLLTAILAVAYYMKRMKKKYAEELEDWELEYGPHRFMYKDLYIATKGFQDKEILGTGGFGRVYRGLLPTSKIQVAVKRVSHESRQGMREFVAEIASLGVASGLIYLHEEWEQVVVHRDVKASNVLLDGELNGRLGDFGLARLYDHGSDPRTTRVVGTLGYLAPEHTRSGKASTSTDVYAFGAFLLEVGCGRRPIEPRAPTEERVLVDWVFSHWNRGEILQAIDSKLGYDYVKEEVELVLKLGLLCSHSEAVARPNMRQILLYLEGAAALPDISSLRISAAGLTFAHGEGFDDFNNSDGNSSTVAASLLSGGR
ncbi:unnamed protein product [Fraxinus pennsylvanica]|uniref:non-specific serine/threonine protein kinase n=1 Tax=Fraxinus pennsylvanica TaxID=56036 RepID=A0AAD1Z7R6_9LAMI|nr:unnamed protein product [Fraxinus pennsylvanica]